MLLQDPDWRINNLYHIYDKDGVLIPFRLNESQEHVWNNLWYLNIILKDRQRGFSTFIAMYILDTCLFTPGIQAGIIDITLDDAKLKLDKIRVAYNHLPVEIKAMVPRTEDKKESIAWFNGSAVRVGTSHRGGTLQILHISEAGKISTRFPERAREIRTGALNTLKPGNMIFNESTAEGNAGEFYEDCQAAILNVENDDKLTKLDYRFHFFGWWMGEENQTDTEGIYISAEDEKYFSELQEKIKEELGRDVVLSHRQKAWYVKKRQQQRDDMMREFPGTPSEAFLAAIEGAYLMKALNKMRKNNQIVKFLPVDPQYPLNTGWDLGISDTMVIWVHQRVQFEERLVGFLSGEDDDILYYWRQLQERYDNPWGTHFLPHDFGHRRAGTSNDPAKPPKTLQQILSDAGMKNSQLVPRVEDKRAGISEVRNWLPKAVINETECEYGLKCLMNFRREWDETLGTWKERPRHDWASHGYDGLESLVRGLNAYGVVSSVVSDKEREGYVTTRRPPPDWRYN